MADIKSIKPAIENFEFHIRYLTPKEQLLDHMLEAYTTQIQCVTKPHLRSMATPLFKDIFNRSVPYVYFFFNVHQNYHNGNEYHCVKINWENITNFQVTLNSNACGPTIKNSKQAYWHLCKTLHADDSHPCPYEKWLCFTSSNKR